jgi:hypothetical protein
LNICRTEKMMARLPATIPSMLTLRTEDTWVCAWTFADLARVKERRRNANIPSKSKSMENR